MSWSKEWEVSLYAELPKGLVMQKFFRSHRRAKRYVRKILGKDDEIHCATIWHEDTTLFYTYYWNGTNIVYWDKPWALSRRQAKNLIIDEYGNAVVKPVDDKGE